MAKGIKSAWKGITGESAAEDVAAAGETAAAAQREGLEYLKETEAIPQAFRQAGLQQLGALSGMSYDPTTGEASYTGDTSAQDALLAQAQANPMYQAQLDQGQEAVARSAAATSGLRGGGTASDLAEFSNQALMNSYNQQLSGIQGLAGLPSQAGQISQQTGQIGETLANAQIAGAQAQQTGMGNLIGLGGILGAAALSDVRLKTNIKYLETTSHPDIHKYSWEWAEDSGKEGYEEGFLAQEVEKTYPDFITEGNDGFKRVYKDKLESKLKELK